MHLTASILQVPQVLQTFNHIYRLSHSLMIGFKALEKNCAGGWLQVEQVGGNQLSALIFEGHPERDH